MLSNLIIGLIFVAQTKPETLPEGTLVEYSKSVDVTMIRLNLKHFSDDSGTLLLSIDVLHKGRAPQAAKEVVLHVYHYGPHWEYAKSHDVQVTCGDEKLKISKVDYFSRETPKRPMERCNEYLDIYVLASDLQGVLEQDRDLKVSIRGRQEFILDEATRSKSLKFLRTVRSGAY